MVATFDRETIRRKAREMLDDVDDLWQPQRGRDLVLELKELSDLVGREPPGPPSRKELVRLGGVVREFADRMWQVGSVRVVEAVGGELGDELAVGFRRLDPEGEAELRSVLLEDLWKLVEADLRQGRNVYAELFEHVFRRQTTRTERRALENWFRELLEDLPENSHVDSPRNVADHWMLEYLGDDLDGDAIETICRDTGHYVRLVDRKLDEGRIDEAHDRAEQASPRRVADLCRAFHERDELGRLANGDVLPDPELEPIPVDELLDTAAVLLDTARPRAALPWIRVAVREGPLHRTLRRVREIAEEAGSWSADVRRALLGEVYDNWPSAAIEHHIEFGDLSAAFELWKSADQFSRRKWRDLGKRLLDQCADDEADDIGVSVALALADSRIEERGRKNYEYACKHLSKARDLIGDSNRTSNWPTILDAYEDRLDRLPAFRDEARDAGLLD